MKNGSSEKIGGKFRFVVVEPGSIKGTGENGAVQFEDLFEGEPGNWSVRSGAKVVKDISTKNKWTKRGLATLMHNSLSGQSSDVYMPSAIDSVTATKNPFLAFFMAGDDGTIVSDQKVLWDESDSASDSKIPAHTSAAGKGRRSILLSDTTGPGLKRVSISYPTTSPYREIEYVFFAQANTPTYATGTIDVENGGTMVDGETFTLDDGINPPLTFEFESPLTSTWDGTHSDNVPIGFSSGDADTVIRDATVAAINQVLDTQLFITAAAGSGGVVDLTHDYGGVIGAVAITTSTSPAFSVSGMTGGSALEGTGGADDEVDNLKAKTVGFAAGVDCSSGQSDNQIGLRSILGTAPAIGGYSDRIYYHEGTGLHKYVSGETLGSVGTDGYVVEDDTATTGELADTIRTITVDSSDSITASNDELYCELGDFSEDDVGRWVTIVGATNNSGDHEIESVITKQRVVLKTDIASDDSGAWTSTTIIDQNYGSYAFDGDVEADFETEVIDLGRNFKSTSSLSNHVIGRVWQTAPAKQIAGVRIVGDVNQLNDLFPDGFTIQYLDASNVEGASSKGLLEPHDHTHWTTIDSAFTGKGSDIFAGGERGLEILFTTPPTQENTFGIRLSGLKSIKAVGGTASSVVVAELMIFGARDAISLVADTNDKMRVALNGTPTGPRTPGAVGSSFREFSVGNVATSGTASNEDMQTVADAINDKVRGYGLEASRNDLGFLLLKGTVAGDKAQLDLDSDDNTSNKSLNADVGFQSSASTVTQSAGATEPIQKKPGQGLTIIYRANISGDL